MSKGFAEHFVEQAEELNIQNGAVLIVDMLNDFCKDGGLMVLKEGSEIIEPIRALIEAARTKKVPVIYINDCHRKDKFDLEFKKRAPHCIEGTWGAEVIEELKPLAEDYCIPKRRFSGFYQTDLDLVLRELGVKTLVVTGVVTNICVMSTIADGFFRGYEIVVPTDCVRATGPREQESTLWDIETHFGTLSDVKSVIEKL